MHSQKSFMYFINITYKEGLIRYNKKEIVYSFYYICSVQSP